MHYTYNRLKGVDKILKPLYAMHEKYTIKRLYSATMQSIFRDSFKDIKKIENSAIRVTLLILFVLVAILISPILLPLYFSIYIVIAAIISLITLIMTIGIGLFFGFMPFLIKKAEKEKRPEGKPFVYKRWYHYLKKPLEWSKITLKFFGINLSDLAFAPSDKIKEYKKDEDFHVINCIGLGFAQLISFLLYFGISFILLEGILSLFFIVIDLAALIIFTPIDIGYKFFSKVNNLDEEIEEIEEEKPQKPCKSSSKVENSKEEKAVVEPEVIPPSED